MPSAVKTMCFFLSSMIVSNKDGVILFFKRAIISSICMTGNPVHGLTVSCLLVALVTGLKSRPSNGLRNFKRPILLPFAVSPIFVQMGSSYPPNRHHGLRYHAQVVIRQLVDPTLLLEIHGDLSKVLTVHGGGMTFALMNAGPDQMCVFCTFAGERLLLLYPVQDLM